MDKQIEELDILDLCSLLQVVGFKIKDIYKESNLFEEKSGKKVHLKCNATGINVVLESKTSECNCPEMNENDDNGKWEMSGTSCGIQISKTENNSSFRKGLISNVAAHVKAELLKLVIITRQKTVDVLSPPKILHNLSVSSSCLNISKMSDPLQNKNDAVNRYRSLDTLNDGDKKSTLLPEPRVLSASQKSILAESNSEIENIDANTTKEKERFKKMIRQNTYTASPTDKMDEITPAPTRTSSPVQVHSTSVRFNLYQAKNTAEELINLLQESIKTMESNMEPDNKSGCGLNVSNISNIKSVEPRGRSASTVSTRSQLPYVSSPNLSRIQESSKSTQSVMIKRLSYQTSPTAIKCAMKTNSLRRGIPKKLSSISPTFGLTNSKKYSNELGTNLLGTYTSNVDKSPSLSTGSLRVRSALKPYALSKDQEPKKRSSIYSHIKSTIPRNFSSLKK